MQRILKAIGIAIAILVVLFAAVWIGFQIQEPELPDGLRPAADAYNVEIIRDTWGVPHIFGRTDADVAYGLAWAHAEDDFRMIQLALLAARGKLASELGADGAPNDYMVGLLRIEDVLEQGYGRLSSDTRAVLDAYAAGLNHYAAEHPDEAVARLYPVRGVDVVRGFVHKVPLMFGLDKILKSLFEDERPDASELAAAIHSENLAGRGRGSNAFAVSPRRSSDGSTFLAVNSHQPWEGPVAWYEVRLKSEAGLDITGGIFPGAPVVLHGRNRNLGWAHTVNSPDLVDVYVLELDPDSPRRYRFGNEWLELEEHTIEIDVRLLGPIRWTFRREALWSVHGPVIERPHGTYALRFAGYGETRHVEQWYRMNRAENRAEWLDAMAMQAIPMFHTVYADRSGNIGYYYNARIPRRSSDFAWEGYLPGDAPGALWSDYLSFEELPRVENPRSGFVQNCNNTPFRTTSGAENPRPDQFPKSAGIETKMSNRGLRALELLGEDASISYEEFREYKYDMEYSPHSSMAAYVERTTLLLSEEHPEISAALRQWDLRTNPGNKHAALAILAFGEWMYADVPPTDEELRRGALDAAEALRKTHGSLEVEWRRVNRLRRGEVDLGLGGGPDVLHAVVGRPEGGKLIGYVGDSYVLLTLWGPTGTSHSESIHQYGSATDRPESPHHADQAPLFVERKLKSAMAPEANLRAEAPRSYAPGQQ